MKYKKKYKKKSNSILYICIFLVILYILNKTLDPYKLRILNLCGIYVVLGLSLNLINGFTGLFSLGHAGFMAIGAYTTALLTMPPAMKEMNFFMQPIVPFLANVEWPFLQALLMGGLVSAMMGFFIGAPVLKLTDDYLAIATLGFAEIIRVVFTNLQGITNGALGLKGIPATTNVWWSWGMAILTILLLKYLMKGSYGIAFKSIKDDEIAAQAMGINLFKHKIMSFTIGSFLAGIGGGLLGNLLGTIDPNMFRFPLTFNILLIVVLGGLGSIKGTTVAAVIITIMMEALRFLDESINLGFISFEGIPGMRMVVFSVLLMAVVIFRKEGLLKES
ncbi:branched-chain amino acid ABC transporter permease [Acidilutibacter cellobiosedens]|jgi:branched-chain amino acid transport system permease protein|uniref:Branched-chain amino acid ABC transporter permease n=1 Tax=Acidilutibacter cellobiosedens TaxID=2507161 RepID=A0A410Q9G6_9FIRM|nr:branched-chain amino acid ABC transporter permease [Acidilutibacter cellobiosedens]QAT60609.1 branched-chain amino acid ABC transporter permease [Acidilutibacter cellobiosedens]